MTRWPLPLPRLYDRLFAAYGPQGWWPARTAFEMMAGAILTQNTAWRSVEKALAGLASRTPLTPRGVLSLHPASLAEAIRPSGYFRQKARRLRTLARWFDEGYSGRAARARAVPTAELRAELLALEGVGPETADSILLYAFARPVFVVDAYTSRILGRLGHRPGGLAAASAPYAAVQELFHRALPAEEPLFNEYHALLVRHAKERCRKTRPLCGGCAVEARCPRARPLRGEPA